MGRSGTITLKPADLEVFDKILEGSEVASYEAVAKDWARVGNYLAKNHMTTIDPARLSDNDPWFWIGEDSFSDYGISGISLPDGAGGIAISGHLSKSCLYPVSAMVRFAKSSRGLQIRGSDKVFDRLESNLYEFQWAGDTIPETVGDIPHDILREFVKGVVVMANQTTWADTAGSAVGAAVYYVAELMFFCYARGAFTGGDVSLEVVIGSASKFAKRTSDGTNFFEQVDDRHFNRCLLDTWNKLCEGTEGMRPDKIKDYIEAVLGRIGDSSGAQRLSRTFVSFAEKYRATAEADSALQALLNVGVIPDDKPLLRKARVALWELIEDRGYRGSKIMALWARIAWRSPSTQCQDCKKLKSPLFWCYQASGLPLPTVYPEPQKTDSAEYINLFNSLSDTDKMVTLCLDCYRKRCTKIIDGMKGPKAGGEDPKLGKAQASLKDTLKTIGLMEEFDVDGVTVHQAYLLLESRREVVIDDINRQALALNALLYDSRSDHDVTRPDI